MQNANTSVVVTHLGSWLLFASLPVVFIASQTGSTGTSNILQSWAYWLCLLYFIVLFYLHTYYLLPHLYRRNQKPLYFFSVAILLALLLIIKPFDRLMNEGVRQGQQHPIDQSDYKEKPPPHDEPFDKPPPPPVEQAPPPPRNNSGQRREESPIDIVSIFMFIVVIAISISSDASKRLRIAAQQAAKAEAEKANAELSVLKAQVNPHFLFNTLNNIYSLAVTGDENTAESIMKLSNIMRYVTDDAPENFVPLQKEVDCITDFIDLQRLRLGDKIKVQDSISGSTEGRSIAPFILLTLVENMFKHSISKTSVSPVIIGLEVTGEGIRFSGSNPLPDINSEDRKGTGIANLKKRLAYLYPNQHTLAVNTGNNLYNVELFIKDKV